jgi:predicted glutamine amidotransferase
MCELLGMECNVPTDITFSFSGLRRRGGCTGPHADGWGLAFYEGPAARVFLEPTPAAESPLARFLAENPIKTLLAIGHVRRKTRGTTCLKNTHPFVRELWGRHFVFAHNGTVKDVYRRKLGRFHPIGDTDSEHAFCVLLEGLRERFDDYPSRPSELWKAIAELGAEVGRDGVFNFLLGDGRSLYARCASKLHYLVRRAPFGLATLADDDVRVDFSAVTTPRDRAAIVATQPLTTNEPWTAGVPGQLWVFDGGLLRATLPSLAAARSTRAARTARLSSGRRSPVREQAHSRGRRPRTP